MVLQALFGMNEESLTDIQCLPLEITIVIFDGASSTVWDEQRKFD